MWGAICGKTYVRFLKELTSNVTRKRKVNLFMDYENGPKVTVVIPTFKRSVAYLSRAVESVVDQTYNNIEIIVIDDSPSLYNKRNEIKKYMEGLYSNRIVYYQNEKSVGGSQARNKGIILAKGDYISFLDDDDEYMPKKIEKQIKFMLEGNYDLSFTDMAIYSANGDIVDYRDYRDIPLYDNDALFRYHLVRHMTGTLTFMFKTEKLREIGGFEDVKMGQEFFLMLKSIKSRLKIGYFQQCDVKVYRHKDGGISQGKNKIDGENNLYEFKQKYFSQLHGDEIRFIKFRHWAVMAFAYKNCHKYFNAFSSGVRAFLVSPADFTRQILHYIIKIYKIKNK